MNKPYLISVLGPTCTGKTSFAIALAKQLGAEIISCDARQIYQQMNIGTAKPSADELAAVQHHFIDEKKITEEFNAGQFETEAIERISQLHKNSQTVIMAGGSGLYAKSVNEGLDKLPPKNEKIRIELERLLDEEGLYYLQDRLLAADPKTYQAIEIENPRRVIRALEVWESSGKSFIDYHNKEKKERPFSTIKIALRVERELLYQRINERVDAMIEMGLVEEVKTLLPYADCNAMQTVGYSEIVSFLQYDIDLEEAIRLIKRNSRRYAKRQMTWFRRVKDITWFEPTELQEAFNHISEQMKEK